MVVGWGVVLVLLSLLAWLGQLLSWLAPGTAVRLGVMEAEDEVEPVYAADIRGEAVWDSFTLWTLLVAGVLLVLDNGAWAYFGLAGGGAYLYFAGRGILTRREIRASGYRVGRDETVRVNLLMFAVWGVAALVTIGAAVAALSPS